jgi:hypothetical protein
MIFRTTLLKASFRLALLLAATPFSVGCADPDSPGTYTLHPVKGSVLLQDGKPLTSGRVVLVNRELAMEFEGKIEPDGGFQAGSNLGDGVPEGTYQVRIEPDTTSLPQAKAKGRAATGKWQFPFSVRYSDEGTSDLTVTVTPGENRLEPFRLASASKKSERASR